MPVSWNQAVWWLNQIAALRRSWLSACRRSANPYISRMTASSEAAAFRTALDLFEAGLDLMRQNLRRTHPPTSRVPPSSAHARDGNAQIIQFACQDAVLM